MTGARSFAYTVNPARIVFGAGSVARLADELRAAGRSRALVLCTKFQKDAADALAASLGGLAVGGFAEAAMHTPVDVTERAMKPYADQGADCMVALGGGSTIGLGKAIAYRNNAMQFVVATTYAGSEVTSILGQTGQGRKTTVRGPEILPEVVIYDPDLTLTLPVAMSVTSGLNAMAHAVEGLYARDRNPIKASIAVEGIRALKHALPAIVNAPQDGPARAQALYGSWLCGMVLGTVGMALHHKLCHTLGGSFDMPHADAHAVLIPYTAAYNGAAADGCHDDRVFDRAQVGRSRQCPHGRGSYAAVAPDHDGAGHAPACLRQGGGAYTTGMGVRHRFPDKDRPDLQSSMSLSFKMRVAIQYHLTARVDRLARTW
jgi:maleylacetate reductase